MTTSDKIAYDMAYLLCISLSRSVKSLSKEAVLKWNEVISLYIQSISDSAWRRKAEYLLQKANAGVHPFKALMAYKT